jgi:UDP-N-acetylmuramoylalanine--D-glutamate ligase
MIPVTVFAGKKVAIFGLGGSGLASASALLAGGADVIGWDDNAIPSSRRPAPAFRPPICARSTGRAWRRSCSRRACR